MSIVHCRVFLFPSINQALASELDHWLRFIASNTLPGNHVLPQVVVILTHLDRMPQGTTAHVMVAWATPAVTKLRARYDGLVDISPNILVVNGTSVDSIVPVQLVVVGLFKELFGKLKWVPEACTRMTAVLAKWRSQNSKWPIMRLSKFNELCFASVKVLSKLQKQDEQAVLILQAIASYLHDVGVIMYFQKLGIVVVDPNWISHVFLGRLMRFPGTTGASGSSMLPSSSDGYVDEVVLRTKLRCFPDNKKHQGFDEKDMIDLMLEFKLCYRERNPGALGLIRYFVPSTLIDVTRKALHGLRQLEWPLAGGDSTSNMWEDVCSARINFAPILIQAFFPDSRLYCKTVCLREDVR